MNVSKPSAPNTQDFQFSSSRQKVEEKKKEQDKEPWRKEPRRWEETVKGEEEQSNSCQVSGVTKDHLSIQWHLTRATLNFPPHNNVPDSFSPQGNSFSEFTPPCFLYVSCFVRCFAFTCTGVLPVRAAVMLSTKSRDATIVTQQKKRVESAACLWCAAPAMTSSRSSSKTYTHTFSRPFTLNNLPLGSLERGRRRFHQSCADHSYSLKVGDKLKTHRIICG